MVLHRNVRAITLRVTHVASWTIVDAYPLQLSTSDPRQTRQAIRFRTDYRVCSGLRRRAAPQAGPVGVWLVEVQILEVAVARGATFRTQ